MVSSASNRPAVPSPCFKRVVTVSTLVIERSMASMLFCRLWTEVRSSWPVAATSPSLLPTSDLSPSVISRTLRTVTLMSSASVRVIPSTSAAMLSTRCSSRSSTIELRSTRALAFSAICLTGPAVMAWTSRRICCSRGRVRLT